MIHDLQILSIDQEYLVALDVETILSRKFNCSVDVASPKTALSFLCSKRYDVVIMDADMALDRVRVLTNAAFNSGAMVLYTSTLCKFPSKANLPTSISCAQKPFHEETFIDVFGRLVSCLLSGNKRA